MTSDEIVVSQLLEESGAIITGSHVIMTSGRHTRVYINVKLVLKSERALHIFAGMIAREYADAPIDVVTGPETGGTKLAIAVARELSILKGREILGIPAKKHPSELKHFYFEDPSQVEGKNVLVVEDVLSTGESVANTVALVKECEGYVFAVIAVVNRGGVDAGRLQAPSLTCLLELPTESWTWEECREYGPCKEGVPINTSVGHGAVFLKEQEAQASV